MQSDGSKTFNKQGIPSVRITPESKQQTYLMALKRELIQNNKTRNIHKCKLTNLCRRS